MLITFLQEGSGGQKETMGSALIMSNVLLELNLISVFHFYVLWSLQQAKGSVVQVSTHFCILQPNSRICGRHWRKDADGQSTEMGVEGEKLPVPAWPLACSPVWTRTRLQPPLSAVVALEPGCSCLSRGLTDPPLEPVWFVLVAFQSLVLSHHLKPHLSFLPSLFGLQLNLVPISVLFQNLTVISPGSQQPNPIPATARSVRIPCPSLHSLSPPLPEFGFLGCPLPRSLGLTGENLVEKDSGLWCRPNVDGNPHSPAY